MIPKKEKGQGLVEYSIILAFLAVVVLAVYYGVIYPNLEKSKEMRGNASEAVIQTIDQVKENGYTGGDVYDPTGGYISCKGNEMEVQALDQKVCVPRPDANTDSLTKQMDDAADKAESEGNRAVCGWLCRQVKYLRGENP